MLAERLSRVSTGQSLLGTTLTCLRERGVRIARARLGLEVQHSEVLAVAWIYKSDTGLEEFLIRLDVTKMPTYQLSPVRPVKEREQREVRLKLFDPLLEDRFNVEADYRKDGLTDYLALPLRSARIRDDVLTFATDQEGGFKEGELELLRAASKTLEEYSHQVAWSLYDRLETQAGTLEKDDASPKQSIIKFTETRSQLPSLEPGIQADDEIIHELGYRLAALERIETPIWVFDVQRMQLLWGNLSAVELWNATSVTELLRREFRLSTTPAMRHQMWMTFSGVKRGEVVNEWVQIEPRGEPKRVYLSHKLVHLSNGDPCILTEALKEPPGEQIVSLAANLALSLALFNDAGELLSYNPAMQTLMGERNLSLRECIGADVDLPAFLNSLAQSQGPVHVESLFETVKGDRWFRIEVRRVESESAAHEILAAFFDITEQRIEQFELRRLANTDLLTQVSNRHGILQRAEELLRQSKLKWVVYVDFDGLKAVNDTHGHAFGDQLLVGAVRRMSEQCDGRAELGRIGGDEFLVLVSVDSPDVAEDIRKAVGLPYFIDDVHVSITASCGVTKVAELAQVDELISAADLAMMTAKRGGKNQVVEYKSELRSRILRLRYLNSGIRRAVSRGELRLVTQPIIDLETGFVAKGENLLRWQSKEFGAISPAEFIPVAEEAGVAVEFGDFVLNQACQLVKDMESTLGFVVPHSVNISAREMAESDFVQRVIGTVSTWGVDPSHIVLEVTETSLIDRLEDAEAVLIELGDAGFKVALDDFGTGYSSLAYIHKLPLDIVKLDQSLVKDLPEQRPIAIVKFITQLVRSLGAEVVGEGVETSVHRACLGGLGCQYGQGYLFGRPLERDAWLAFCKANASPALRRG